MVDVTASFHAFNSVLSQAPGKRIHLSATLDFSPIILIVSASGETPRSTDISLAGDTLTNMIKPGILQFFGVDDKKVLFEIDILEDIEECVHGQPNTARSNLSYAKNETLDQAKVTIFLGDTKWYSDQIILRLKRPIGNKDKVDMSRDIKIYVEALPYPEGQQIWINLKQVLHQQTMHVLYADNKARLINMAYKSDLEPWFENHSAFDGLGDYVQESVKTNDAEMKSTAELISKFLESAKSEVQCTLGACANCHPWPVRGTLHPWKTQFQNGTLMIDYGKIWHHLMNETCQCNQRNHPHGSLFV